MWCRNRGDKMNLSRQQQAVFNYIREHGTATVRELFPYTNYPTCIIRDLKKKGINIIRKSIPNKNYDDYEIAQ